VPNYAYNHCPRFTVREPPPPRSERSSSHVSQSTTPHPPLHIHHSTSTTLFITLLVILAAAFALAPPAHAQIPTGTLTPGDPTACYSGTDSEWYAGMTCQGVIINCSNVDANVASITATIGYVTQSSSPKGTIVFFTGGAGTQGTLGTSGNAFANAYVSNYMIVYVEWTSAWETSSSTASERNILSAACRPATLLAWINSSSIHPIGAMCAQGKSAGSAAIAYSMSWYGADSYLTNVELLAGPVLSEINQGCTSTPPTVTMCSGLTTDPLCYSTYKTSGGWSTSAAYTSNDASGINAWAGVSDCGSSSSDLTRLQQMSIVGGVYGTVTPKYIFSTTTKRHGWVCAGPNTNYYMGATDCPGFSSGCPNNSSPQGWYWYGQAGNSDSNLVVTGTNACKGDGTAPNLYYSEAEGIESGIDPTYSDSETTEIESDMTGKCSL